MKINFSRQTFDSFRERVDILQKKLTRKVVFPLLSWIPTSFGTFLRSLFYRFILADIKHSSKISPFVHFRNPEGIHVGDNVIIESFTRFCSFGLASELHLHAQVLIRRHAEIKLFAPGKESSRADIGENTRIGPHTCLYGQSISIGKNCLIGPYVGIFATNHVFDDLSLPICEQGNSYKGIVIEDDCWLGTGSKVLDGVRIGHGSVVGAGAVVTEDLPPYSIAVGIPARVIKKRNGQRSSQPGRALHPSRLSLAG